MFDKDIDEQWSLFVSNGPGTTYIPKHELHARKIIANIKMEIVAHFKGKLHQKLRGNKGFGEIFVTTPMNKQGKNTIKYEIKYLV